MPAPDDPFLEEGRRIARRGRFSVDAERYDRVRPGYPDELFDAVAAYGVLPADARVLEIAPGTGQATRTLVARGWRVEAVELGAAMAAVARQRLGDGVRITIGAFEEQPPPDPLVDLVFCATAFHWLDPAVRLERIAAALPSGGVVAIVWTRHVRGGSQDFFDAAQACYGAFGGDDPSMGVPPEESVRPRTVELERSPLFQDVAARRFTDEIDYRTAEFLDLLRTYSETIALPDDRRDGLLGCLGGLLDTRSGGRVTKRYLFDLVLARGA